MTGAGGFWEQYGTRGKANLENGAAVNAAAMFVLERSALFNLKFSWRRHQNFIRSAAASRRSSRLLSTARSFRPL